MSMYLMFSLEIFDFKRIIASLAGTKFFVVCEPGTQQMEALLKVIYELYTDYVLKNPFYEIEMPIRCELFDFNLSQTVQKDCVALLGRWYSLQLGSDLIFFWSVTFERIFSEQSYLLVCVRYLYIWFVSHSDVNLCKLLSICGMTFSIMERFSLYMEYAKIILLKLTKLVDSVMA